MRGRRGRSVRVQPLDRARFDFSADLPVDPCRHGLYTAAELYDTDEYAASRDARAFEWSHEQTTSNSLAWAVHDHAVDEALEAWVHGRRLVGIMGGHATRRGEPAYAEAARFGHAVGGDLTVATGGGPGSMEAANLGAYLAHEPVEALEQALATLSRAPGFRPVDDWLVPAREVLAAHPHGSDSLGIPTWFYGHEPTNVFATG